jgi:hypothetical protein
MTPRSDDPLGLRPEPGSTSPKTGKAPPPTVGAAAGSGNIDSDRRFGIPADRSVSRVTTTQDRRTARKAASAAELKEESTREDLYERAQELDIEGRSDMNKDELAKAVAKAERASAKN